MPLRFDLGDLQAFVQVTDLRGFRRAAEALHLSQPALSRRIDKLESALGVRLLERTKRKVEPTALGREFLVTARATLDTLDSALLYMRDVGATRAGEVKIACVPSAAYFFLPPILAEFRARFPRIRVLVWDATASDVLVAVARAECDFGINFLGQREPELEFQPLLTDRFVAACRRDHPLARRRRITWREFLEYPFLTVTKRSGNRLLIDQALNEVGLRPQAMIETQHITTLLGLVEAGLGPVAVPALAVPGGGHPLLTAVALVEPEIERAVGIIRRRGRTPAPAALAVLELIRERSDRPAARTPQVPITRTSRRRS